MRVFHAFMCTALSCGIHAQDSVLYHWSGALSATNIRVHATLSGVCDSVRLLVDDDPLWGSPLYTTYGSADTLHGLVVPLRRPGLQPSTNYAYRFEIAGVVDTSAANTGRFRTPAAGAHSFSFVTGSCNNSGEHPVWQSMLWLQPLFFLSSGDLHYADPASTDVVVHRNAYNNLIHTKHPMTDFMRRVPLAYVWDDHDFCGNGTYGNAPGKAAAAQAFRDCVPHYALVNDTAVYQAFTIGRVRFILTDMRATKDTTHMMDSAQHVWLREQFLLARDSGWVACWTTPLTWNSIGYSENWGSQPAERETLSNWLRTNEIDDLFLLSGDAHMLAIDDGTNCDFSTGQNSPYRYPIMQAAGINRGGSYKGGTFNQGGYFPNPNISYGQFGEVVIDDDGTDVCITLNAWRTDSMGPALTLMSSYTFCRTPQAIDSFVTTKPAAALHAWYASGTGLHVEGTDGSDALQVMVVDASGRTVALMERIATDGTLSLRLSELRAGHYIAIVRHAEERAIVKFVKE